MKKSAQLCNACKRQPTCQDYKDNMRMREEGLVIDIIECDIHIPLKVNGL